MAGAKRYLSRMVVNTSDDGSSSVQLIAPVRFSVSYSSPASPASGFLFYSKAYGGAARLFFKSEAGGESAVNVSLATRHVEYLQAHIASYIVHGLAGVTVSGTQFTNKPNDGNNTTVSGNSSWIGYYGGTAVGSGAYMLLNNKNYLTNDGSGLDGFFSVQRVGFSMQTPAAGPRAFFGFMSGYPTGANVEPSTQTQCIGLAVLSTDSSQYYLVYGGTTAQPAIPTGIPIYDATSAGFRGNAALVDLTIQFYPSETATCRVHAERVGGGFSFDKVITGSAAVLPTIGAKLYLAAWSNNNTVASSVISIWVKIYTSRLA